MVLDKNGFAQALPDRRFIGGGLGRSVLVEEVVVLVIFVLVAVLLVVIFFFTPFIGCLTEKWSLCIPFTVTGDKRKGERAPCSLCSAVFVSAPVSDGDGIFLLLDVIGLRILLLLLALEFVALIFTGDITCCCDIFFVGVLGRLVPFPFKTSANDRLLLLLSQAIL